MRIQHNIMAMSSYRNYTNNVSAMKKNLEKLSSGYKINRAGDDAAGLAISEKMRAQITGLKQAQANAKSGINLVQTAEGALQEVQDMMNRMVKLAEQSANGTYDVNVDRNQLQKEFDQLKDEINRINQSANFNGINLFGGPNDAGTPPTTTDPEETEGLTAADITQPTNNPTYTDGDSGNTAAKVEIDFTGVAFAKAGTVSVTVGGKAYDVTVTEDTDAAGFADAFVAAYNAADTADKISDATAGAFTAVASNGKVTLTSAEKEDVADATLKTALKAKPTIEPKATPAETAEEGEEAATKKYESTVTTGGATSLAANDTIKIGGKTYTIKATAGGADEIGLDTAATFDAQMAKAVEEYNKVASEDFTAAYDAETGKMTFTVKDGKTPANAPTFTITDNANKISAGEVTEVEEPEEPEEPETPTGNGATPIGSLNIQIGDTGADYNRMVINRYSISSASIFDISEGTGKTLDELGVDTEDNARNALSALKGMVNYISDIRGELGAKQNRLDHTINNLSVMEENIQDAESTIRDTDIADEMMAYTKNNILIQSAQAMLAQANQVPQGVLQLLQ